MGNFTEWMDRRHPGALREGVLDSLGRSRLVRGAVATAGLMSAGLPSLRGEPPAAMAGDEEAMIKRGPENYMVSNPSLAPEWYRPHLVSWYRAQIRLIEKNQFKYIPYLVKDDRRWIDDLLAVNGNSDEVKSHVYYISDHDDNFEEMVIKEPLKNPLELINKVSIRYHDLLIRFYKIKIKEIEELEALERARASLPPV